MAVKLICKQPSTTGGSKGRTAAVKTKTVRNRSLTLHVLEGATVTDAAQAYEISATRAKIIIEREIQKAKLPGNIPRSTAPEIYQNRKILMKVIKQAWKDAGHPY